VNLKDISMTTPDEGIAAQIRNIEARYGKPMQDWFGLIADSGLAKHTEVVAMLKADHGMTHGGRTGSRCWPARQQRQPQPTPLTSFTPGRRPASGRCTTSS
jgi:hypothetical protein